jgi:hypothetical protein
MVSAATVLRWSQRTRRLTVFVSDNCRGRNYGSDGVGNRSGGVVATETEAVVRGGWWQWKQRQQWWKHRGRGASGRKIGSGGGHGGRRNRGSSCSSGNSGNRGGNEKINY